MNRKHYLSLVVAVGMLFVTTSWVAAQGKYDKPRISAQGPRGDNKPRTWQDKQGHIVFTGTLGHQLGDSTIIIRNDNRSEISFPTKYLSDDCLQFLTDMQIDVSRFMKSSGNQPVPPNNNLAGNSPSPNGRPSGFGSSRPTRPSFGSGGSGNQKVSGNPFDGGEMIDGEDDKDPFAGGSKTEEPAKPEETRPAVPEKVFAPGAEVELNEGGNWIGGKILAHSRSQNRYFVQYVIDGRPKSGWFTADKIRDPQAEDEKADTGNPFDG